MEKKMGEKKKKNRENEPARRASAVLDGRAGKGYARKAPSFVLQQVRHRKLPSPYEKLLIRILAPTFFQKKKKKRKEKKLHNLSDI